MKLIIAFIVFCCVLFLYLHIQFHLKTSNDLEIYELDEPSKEKLEDLCNIRQPILINTTNEFKDKLIYYNSKDYLVNNYSAFDIKIRNLKLSNEENLLYLPLKLEKANLLFKEDKNASYISENNNDFLDETGLIKNISIYDNFLRPYFVSNIKYDILIGSNDANTPFRYNLNYRSYYLVTKGSVRIKLAPPNAKKYLYTNYDYENFEFKSLINIWQPQDNYKSDYDKIKFLEFDINEGQILYIPAYWYYSFKLKENSSLCCLFYKTYMNNLALIPYYFQHFLQLQNIKFDNIKKVNIITNPTPNIPEQQPNMIDRQTSNYTDQKE